MRNVIIILAFSCSMPTSIAAGAQQWTVYGGASLGYDGFFEDRAITKFAGGWPFYFGGGLLGGVGYKATNGFDVFAELNAGILSLNMPVPENNADKEALIERYARVMAGSGPRILIGQQGNSITPFIQLGGIYLKNSGNASSGKSGRQLEMRTGSGFDAWAIAVGAGIDWKFKAKLSSSLNLNFSYTPLNVFNEPVQYTITTAGGVHDIDLQGKLLQVLLSYRIHINVGKDREEY